MKIYIRIRRWCKVHPNRLTLGAYMLMFLLPLLFHNVFKDMLIWYTVVPILTLFFDLWVRHLRFNWKKEIQELKKFAWIKALIYTLTLYVINVLMVYGETMLSGKNIPSVNTSDLLQIGNEFNMIYIYILLIAPVLEELTFRQSLFNGLVNQLKKIDFKPFTNHKFPVIVSAWIIAFLFALVHNDVYLLSYEVVSLWLQYIYYHEKKISYAIFAHIGSNLITLFVVLFV